MIKVTTQHTCIPVHPREAMSRQLGATMEMLDVDKFLPNLKYILNHREDIGDNRVRKITQVQVAERLKVCVNLVYRWLVGSRRPQILEIMEINIWASELRSQRQQSVLRVSSAVS